MMIKYRKKFKKKKKNLLVLANLHIKCTLKNTIIYLTKNTGDVLKQWSTKSLKKSRFKKNTPYNIQLIIYKVNKFIQLKKIKKLKVHFDGSGFGRYKIFRSLRRRKNIKIPHIFDRTSRPFNGCRVKKMRRL